MRFRSALVLLFAAAVVFTSTAGCEDVEGLPPGYADLCADGTVPWATHVKVDPPYDSTEIRDGRDASGTKTIDKRGTACASAGDVAACNAKYGAVDLKANGSVAFVATRGDDVIVKNVASLGSAELGAIDDPYEAAVLAVPGDRERAPMKCDNGQAMGFKKSGGGYEIAHIELDACTGRKTRIVTGVDPDGTTREISSETVFAGEQKVCD